MSRYYEVSARVSLGVVVVGLVVDDYIIPRAVEPAHELGNWLALFVGAVVSACYIDVLAE